MLLRTLRQRANLTQEELGLRASLSAKAIGALERGERQIPNPSTVRSLADALQLDDDDRRAFLDTMQWRGRSLVSDQPPPPAPAVDPTHQSAAWELCVELITRIAVVELPPDRGLLRDALTSLYTLFDVTRRILKNHGPAVVNPSNGSEHNVGLLALTIVNDVLRPVLTEWHPALLDYESQRPDNVSPAEHERAWERSEELRQVLGRLRVRLHEHAQQLAAAAGVLDPRSLDGR